MSRPSPQNHGQNDAAMEEVHYQSNIPTECYVRRCRAELAHDQAAALSNGAATTGRVGPDELPPTTIQWAHGSSVCQAIVAASYAPGKLDYAVLIVENPPSVKLELDYEFVPRQAAQVDYLGYRVDQENGRLMLLKSMSIIEPEDRDAGSAELFCYAYDDKVLYRGSPLIDPVSSLVVGVHGIGGIDLCEQSSATLIKALKQTLAVFPESGLPEDPAE